MADLTKRISPASENLEQELFSTRARLDQTLQELLRAKQQLERQELLFNQQRLAALNIAKDAEESRNQLAGITEELKQSNSDLEQFAYIASHDLKTPIRHILMFAGTLDQELGPILTDDAKECVQGILLSGRRMEAMIHDLLGLAKLGLYELNIKSVDLTDRVALLKKALLEKVNQTGAIITCSTSSKIKMDSTLVDQLLQNLIENALKYQKKGVQPQVEIGCDELDSEWRIWIKDNGIGIETDSYERIFQIFQRLHRRSEYAGTGIGLSICKRIVKLHGGHIWCESEKGKGSTFFFTIPKEIPKNHGYC